MSSIKFNYLTKEIEFTGSEFFIESNFDALVKSMETPFSVIPAQAGIQSFQGVPMGLDTRFRGYDDFLRGRQF